MESPISGRAKVNLQVEPPEMREEKGRINANNRKESTMNTQKNQKATIWPQKRHAKVSQARCAKQFVFLCQKIGELEQQIKALANAVGLEVVEERPSNGQTKA